MLIKQYGIFIQIQLADGASLEKNLRSFDDVPEFRLEEISELKLTSKEKSIFTFYKKIEESNSRHVLDVQQKGLPGWSLKYFLKRRQPDLFKDR